MIEEMLEQKYSLAELVSFYADYKPESDIGLLVSAIGAFNVSELIANENLQGTSLYIPKPKILNQVFLVLSVRDELKNLPEDSAEFKARLKELSKTFDLTKNEILKVNKDNRSVKCRNHKTKKTIA